MPGQELLGGAPQRFRQRPLFRIRQPLQCSVKIIGQLDLRFHHTSNLLLHQNDVNWPGGGDDDPALSIEIQGL
jgi:hypothetical protein